MGGIGIDENSAGAWYYKLDTINQLSQLHFSVCVSATIIDFH